MLVVRCAAVCLLLVFASARADAQSNNAEAEALFRQGRALIAEKRYAEACAALESSHKLDPTVNTLYALGVCRELEGRLATAWGVFIDVERKHKASSNQAEQELATNAGKRAAKLEPRLSKLIVSVPAESRLPGLQVRRAGDVVDPGAWDRPLPVDGGTFQITAQLADHESWSTTVTIQNEGDSKTVSIPKLAPTPTPTPTPTPVAPPPSPVDVVTEEPTRERSSRTIPLAFAGGALTLTGTAIAFELWGRGLHGDAQKTLDAGDDQRAFELQDSANLRRYIAQGFGIAAVGCAVASVVLFVRTREESSTRTSLRLMPTATDTHAGLSLGGVW